VVPIFVALALLAIFVQTAHEVAENEWSAADTWILLHLHALASPAADVIMRGLTFFGSAPVVIPLVIVTLVWCLRRGERQLAAWLAIVALVAEATNVALKLCFVRARPALWPGALHLDSYSFPSGHSMSAAATLGMIAVVVARLAPRLRLAVAIVAPLVILGIGLSRMYLGVHWPSDVLAGFAAGSLLLFGGALASGRPRR
jgi:membrane-associated phospholipid phosphatase